MESEEESPRMPLRTNFKKIHIDILCEWIDCKFSCKELKLLQEHLISHLRILCVQIESNDDGMICGICSDPLKTDFSSLRHMYYHAYHFYLKSRGKYIMNINKLRECTLDTDSANVIPCLVQPFICQWDNCNYSSDNISDFYDHVDYHPVGEDNVDTDNQKCKWINCNFTTKTINRLQTHLSLHCEKRYIACPTCGICFSSTSKFSDHLKRQIVSVWNKQMQDEEMAKVLSTLANTHNPVIPLPKPIVAPPKEAFQCNLCMHLFATKRLLKDHEGRHILTMSCPHCFHTCSSRYALKRHILFRHTEEKPFKCTDCDMGFKCNDGLKRHMASIHGDVSSSEPVNCDVFECAYVAKNRRALNIHKSRIHCKVQTIVTKVYVCHKCEQEYVVGHHLTEHLSKEHSINKTSNRYRHQYKICADGKYRLNIFDLKLKSALNERNKGTRDESLSLLTDTVEDFIQKEPITLKESPNDQADFYQDYAMFPVVKLENIEVVDVFD